jgi:fatty acid-binding protein DegV
VNKTIAASSSIFHVMPLLTFHEGEILRAGLVRTVNKGMERIYDFVKNNSPIKELTIVHSQVVDQANELKRRFSEFIQEEEIAITELGAGLGPMADPEFYWQRYVAQVLDKERYRLKSRK